MLALSRSSSAGARHLQSLQHASRPPMSRPPSGVRLTTGAARLARSVGGGRCEAARKTWGQKSADIPSDQRRDVKPTAPDPGVELELPWTDALKNLQNPNAIRIYKQLDLTRSSLGLTREMMAGLSDARGKNSSVRCFDVMQQMKQLYPRHIILVKVGTFYETGGVDAVLVVEFAGVNPDPNLPQAGIHQQLLSSALRKLVRKAGFSVVIVEEVPKALTMSSSSKVPTERYIGGVITPANPIYQHPVSYVDELEESASTTRPVLGLARLGHSYTMFVLAADNLTDITESSPPQTPLPSLTKAGSPIRAPKPVTLQVKAGLTEEASIAEVQALGAVAPLFIHESIRALQPGALREWRQRMKAHLEVAVDTVEEFHGDMSVLQEAFLKAAGSAMGLLPRQQLAVRKVENRPANRTAPPYLCTTGNLGLGLQPLHPSLLDAMLGADCPRNSRILMRSMVLRPPSQSAAGHIREAISLLTCPTTLLPTFATKNTPSKIAALMHGEQSQAQVFKDVYDIVRPVRDLLCGLQSPELSSSDSSSSTNSGRAAAVKAQLGALATAVEDDKTTQRLEEGFLEHSERMQRLAEALVPVVADMIKAPLTLETMALALGQVVQLLEGVLDVSLLDEVAGLSQAVEAGAVAQAPYASTDSADEGDGEETGDSIKAAAGAQEVMTTMFSCLEAPFKNSVRAYLIRDALDKLDNAKQRAGEEVEAALRAVMQAAGPAGANARGRPMCVWKSNDKAVWIKFPPEVSPDMKAAALAAGLENPKDRKGGRRPVDFWSTKGMDETQQALRVAAYEADQAAKAVLKDAAKQLQPHKKYIIAATQAALLLRGLLSHVNACFAKGWCQTEGGSQGVEEGGLLERGVLDIQGFMPYWLDPRSVGAAGIVRNSCHLDGMLLLTGPNMGGKSTVLRAICAVALLGSCGLMAPAERAVVPFLDFIMLRNFSGDSPLEGRSAFAMEMAEIKGAAQDATARSLVLIDELGKGTEGDAGAAIAGALLERFDQKGCRGVFASHHHLLLEMELELQRTQNFRMGTTTITEPGRSSKTVPTWRLEPGTSGHTLAFEVALQQGLPVQLVQRAQHHYSNIIAILGGQPLEQGGGDMAEGQEPDGAQGAAGTGATEGAMGSDTSDMEAGGNGAEQAEDAEALLRQQQEHQQQQQQQEQEVMSRGRAAASAEGDERAALLELREHFQAAIVNWQLDLPPSAAGLPLPAIQYLPLGFQPPAATSRGEVVYLVRWPLCKKHGREVVRAGHSSDFQGRCRAHRKRGGLGALFAVVQCGVEAAKLLETRLHQVLMRSGVPLDSYYDGKKMQKLLR